MIDQQLAELKALALKYLNLFDLAKAEAIVLNPHKSVNRSQETHKRYIDKCHAELEVATQPQEIGEPTEPGFYFALVNGEFAPLEVLTNGGFLYVRSFLGGLGHLGDAANSANSIQWLSKISTPEAPDTEPSDWGSLAGRSSEARFQETG